MATAEKQHVLKRALRRDDRDMQVAQPCVRLTWPFLRVLRQARALVEFQSGPENERRESFRSGRPMLAEEVTAVAPVYGTQPCLSGPVRAIPNPSRF